MLYPIPKKKNYINWKKNVRVGSLVLFLYFFFYCTKEKNIYIFAPSSTSFLLSKFLKERCLYQKCYASYGSSSLLSRQILYGASVDIFISADPLWIDKLSKKDIFLVGSRQTLFQNRIHLAQRKTSKAIPQNWRTLVELSPCLLVGEPKYVPLGRYSKESLETFKLWKKTYSRLAFTSNASQNLIYLRQQVCPLGILYESDIKQNQNIQSLFAFPSSSHSPIKYEIILLKKASQESQDLYLKFLDKEARKMYQNSGFSKEAKN